MAKSVHKTMLPTSGTIPAARVRLADVARYAQVSKATAARALSDKGYVREATRQKVLEAADVLAYEPNLLAKGLRSGTTTTVGLLWSMARLSPAGDILQQLSVGLQRAGYSTHLVNDLSHPNLTMQALADLAQRNSDGVVLQATNVLRGSVSDVGSPDGLSHRTSYRDASAAVPPHRRGDIHRLLGSFRAVMITGSIPLEGIPYDCVFQNPERAIRDIVDHFVRRGRRSLGMLMPASGNDFKQRIFIDQAARHGCRVRAIDVPRTDNGVTGQDYERALHEQCGRSIDFDALFCIPDEGAARAMTYLRRLGRRVPDDVAVVGYNDSTFAADMWPPLASVARHDDILIEVVLDRLLSRLRGECDQQPLQHCIEMEFVPRESAG